MQCAFLCRPAIILRCLFRSLAHIRTLEAAAGRSKMHDGLGATLSTERTKKPFLWKVQTLASRTLPVHAVHTDDLATCARLLVHHDAVPVFALSRPQLGACFPPKSRGTATPTCVSLQPSSPLPSLSSLRPSMSFQSIQFLFHIPSVFLFFWPARFHSQGVWGALL